MTKKFVVLGVLLGLLTFATGISGAASAPAAAAPQVLKGSNEQHPHIRGAIRELREARRELETANHDFGGHRKEAIEAVDNAVKQLQVALQFDKK